MLPTLNWISISASGSAWIRNRLSYSCELVGAAGTQPKEVLQYRMACLVLRETIVLAASALSIFLAVGVQAQPRALVVRSTRPVLMMYSRAQRRPMRAAAPYGTVIRYH